MTVITDKGSLKAAIANYMHRTNLDDQMDGWIDIATKRIGRDLRSMANQIILDPFEVTVQLNELPTGYQALKELSYTFGGRRVQVLSGSANVMSAFVPESSMPKRYKVHGNQIEIKPFSAREYRLIYWESPDPLLEDGDTNAVLDEYSYLYLYAALIEANFYVQNAAARQLSLDTYTGEVEEINRRNASSDAGGSPLTIGM